MTNELTAISIDYSQLPVNWSDDTFDDLSKSTSYLGRLQLYTKGNAINRKLIGTGEYGIPVSKDEIIGLGESVDVIVLARRPKAVDMSDTDAIVTSYDPNSDVFKDIASRSSQQNSGCMYGPSFLVWERTTQRFLEFFCGTKSSRGEAGKIYAFCPVTAEQIEAMQKAGKPTNDLTPHGPLPMTLRVKLCEKGNFSWHAPIAMPCSNPFTHLPSAESVMVELDRFLNVKDEGPEKVVDTSVKSSRRVR
jgi:hypothetical protein